MKAFLKHRTLRRCDSFFFFFFIYRDEYITHESFSFKIILRSPWNRIGGVMVSVLASSVVDRGFDPRSGQTKDYNIGICFCFSTKDAALRRKDKD